MKLRKAYIFLKCEEPDNTYLIVRERIKAIEHHYGSFCYGKDVEIITEMAWEGSPKGKIHKYDVSIAKNYLSEDELANLS